MKRFQLKMLLTLKMTDGKIYRCANLKWTLFKT